MTKYLKWLIVLIIPLLFANANSADYADSFAQYRYMVKAKLDISTSNTSFMSDSVLNQLVREAVVEVNGAIKGVKATDSFVTTFRQGVYTLDTAVTGVIDVRMSKNADVKTYLYRPKELWFQQNVNKDTSASYYDYYDNILYLYPIPDKATSDTIKVTVWKKVESISASDNLSTIKQKYRTAIVNYVTYMVALAKSHPLTEFHYNNYVRSMNLINGSYNGGRTVETTNLAN